MSRLTHSSSGFLRSLQVSSAQFFAFVEGGIDRPFFERIVMQICEPLNLRHQVIAVREVSGSAGGKTALLKLFSELRKKRLLTSAPFGKKMALTFFVDKDCDDFCRRKLRSPHLFYSDTYDIESHLFSCGNLQRALADACGLTLQQAQQTIPNQQAWLGAIASHWKAWIALCLITNSKHLNCGCTYDRVSQINPQPFAAPEQAALQAYKLQISQAAGLSHAALEKLFVSTCNRIEATLAAGQPMRYFKGKWLLHALQKYLETIPRTPDALINGAGEKVRTALLAQVATRQDCRCCAPYSVGIASIAAQL